MLSGGRNQNSLFEGYNQSLLSGDRNQSSLFGGCNQSLLFGGCNQSLLSEGCNQSLPSGGNSQSLLLLSCSHISTVEEGFNNLDKILSTTKLCCSKVPKAEFKSAAKQIETALQQYILRYTKIPSDIAGNFILAVLKQDLDKENYVYRERLNKVQSNVSTWKNQTLQRLEVSHTSRISAMICTNILFRTTSKPQLPMIKSVCWLMKQI